jgi:nitrogen regulatory protein PII
MKQVIAIIKPNRTEKVIEALEALPHFPGYTLLEGRGQGRGRGPGGVHQVSLADIENNRKAVLLVVCADALAPEIVEAIRGAAHTGLPEDGIIWTVELQQVMRIRTGETGRNAV